MNQERFNGFMAAYRVALTTKVKTELDDATAGRLAATLTSRIATARQAIWRADYAPARVDGDAVTTAMAQLGIKPKGAETAHRALDRYLERLV